MEGLLLLCGLKPQRVGQFRSVRASQIGFLSPMGWVIRVHMTPNLKGHEFKVPDYNCTENTQLFSPKSQFMIFCLFSQTCHWLEVTLKEQSCSEANQPCSWEISPIWSSEGFLSVSQKDVSPAGDKMRSLISFVLCLLLHQEMGAAIRSVLVDGQFSSCRILQLPKV